MPRKILSLLTEVLVDNLTDAAIGIDKEGKIHLFNPAAVQLFGITVRQAMGNKVWDALPMNEFTKGLIAMVKESNPSFTERTYAFPQDRIFLGQLLPVRNEEGRVAGAVSLLRDLTHLHAIEGHVTDFVGNVSHELRIPLTSIKGFVETLLEGALADPVITRKFLQVINEETNRMARLLMSLQDATRASAPSPAQAAVDIGRLLGSAIDTLKPLAAHKNVVIETNLPDRLPTAQGDEDALMQVVTNLIDNAIKFTAIKGSSGNVTISASYDDQVLQVAIHDNGVGIPAEEIERIFERFYRVRQGPAAQLGGTGLGLSISRDIARAHGGDIRVESQPVLGSRFIFTLPLTLPNPPPLPATAPSASSRKPV